jgi:hypothetical protein
MKMPSKKVIYALAAHFDKDHRTVRDWFKNNNVIMLNHPELKHIVAKQK